MFFKRLLNKFNKTKDLTLEHEFEKFKAIHKYSILYAVIKKYYSDLQDTNTVDLPAFVKDNSPDILTQREMRRIYTLSGDTFNRLYEKAWQEVATLLD